MAPTSKQGGKPSKKNGKKKQTFTETQQEKTSSSSKSSVGTPSTNERDEIEEVEKFAQKDTKRIRRWRFVIVYVLMASACAVSLTTLNILQARQLDSFYSAFDTFANAVGEAAILHQQVLTSNFRAIADSISVDANRTGVTWPYYTTPFFELYAGSAINRTGSEVAGVFVFVEGQERDPWINFADENYQGWVAAGHLSRYGNLDRLNQIASYHSYITQQSVENGSYILDDIRTEYWPSWLYSPPPSDYGSINWNVASNEIQREIIDAMETLRGESILSSVLAFGVLGNAVTDDEHTETHNDLETGSSLDHPHALLQTPIYEVPGDSDSKIVAYIGTGFSWDSSLRNLLPDDVHGMHAVISNDCKQKYTYKISGPDAYFVGEGDLHEIYYDDEKMNFSLSLLTHPLKDLTSGHCQYTLDLYPSAEFEDDYDSNTPQIFAVIVGVTFTLIAVVFVVYDMLVRYRNDRLVQNAARSNAVVSALFPGQMRERILERQLGTKSKMKSFITDGQEQHGTGNKPLADLFLETSIMFADITGFTAWSSVREPSQVFTLLESVYGAFDDIAKIRKIFKVETVGDCYVAAAGIPEPRKDHATAIARFAWDCLECFSKLSKSLEVSLGPQTGELGIRVGIHSGPVTAGVLRGEKARFQLFGDTMNVTARMESASEAGRILTSAETAEILRNDGREHWLERRKDLVNAKGKGLMQTFWVSIRDQPSVTTSSSDRSSRRVDAGSKHGGAKGDRVSRNGDEQKQRRLVDWNVEMLARLIKQIVARRQASSGDEVTTTSESEASTIELSGCPLDEVKEIIMLPEFDIQAAKKQVDADEIELDPKVIEQLRSYVTTVCKLYYANPFHNFEHASHVVMSVMKLMSRIVAPDAFHDYNATGPYDNVARSMHDHTYGITSDPLTQFACAFSALIHDVDHRGVPNTQLIKENQQLGEHYKGRSVAEQNSLDLSWELLMDSRYDELRATICATREELRRLRELVVNVVLATDIMDKDLKALRNGRWEKAFAHVESSGASEGSTIEDRNRKATIVIEHLIQASDVAHTMQHWHVYRQWNKRLFEELYRAYKAGRADKDPSEFWYKGELGFFDFYIIPLAKKLKECGVFGVSSGEYLNYAMNNRMEWERRGNEMIAEMMESLKVNEEPVKKTATSEAVLYP